MHLKQDIKFSTIFLSGINKIKPSEIGFLEIKKNSNGRKFFKPVLAGGLNRELNIALLEIIRIINKEKEGL